MNRLLKFAGCVPKGDLMVPIVETLMVPERDLMVPNVGT